MNQARESFLRAHAEDLYDALTDRCTRPLRLEELLPAAAAAVPGLVPASAQLDAERTRMLTEKEGIEFAQGLLVGHVLAVPQDRPAPDRRHAAPGPRGVRAAGRTAGPRCGGPRAGPGHPPRPGRHPRASQPQAPERRGRRDARPDRVRGRHDPARPGHRGRGDPRRPRSITRAIRAPGCSVLDSTSPASTTVASTSSSTSCATSATCTRSTAASPGRRGRRGRGGAMRQAGRGRPGRGRAGRVATGRADHREAVDRRGGAPGGRRRLPAAARGRPRDRHPRFAPVPARPQGGDHPGRVQPAPAPVRR